MVYTTVKFSVLESLLLWTETAKKCVEKAVGHNCKFLVDWVYTVLYDIYSLRFLGGDGFVARLLLEFLVKTRHQEPHELLGIMLTAMTGISQSNMHVRIVHSLELDIIGGLITSVCSYTK